MALVVETVTGISDGYPLPIASQESGMDVALDLFGSEIFLANEIELAANVNDATDGLFESGRAVCSGYNAVAIPRSIAPYVVL